MIDFPCVYAYPFLFYLYRILIEVYSDIYLVKVEISRPPNGTVGYLLIRDY